MRHRHFHTHPDADRRFARREHDRHHGHGSGRSGLGRFFAHGDLRLVILQLIAEKPRHGYEIIKAIEDRVAGTYSPSPGVIYPTLTLLEELGYVTVSAPGDSARKLHEITAQGRSFLDANRPALDALLARMEEAGRAESEGPPRRIRHAMESLKIALRRRLAGAPLSEAQADAMATAIEAAATTVENA